MTDTPERLHPDPSQPDPPPNGPDTVYLVRPSYGDHRGVRLYRDFPAAVETGLDWAAIWLANEGAPDADLVPVPSGLPLVWWWEPINPDSHHRELRVEIEAWQVHTSGEPGAILEQ